MANCFIDFVCRQQELKRTDKNTVAANAAETVAARFDLCAKWDGLQVFARFQHGQEVYDVPVSDGCATVPHEVMRETGFNVSIFGEDASGARLTSARVFVDVEPTISYDGAPPIPATPSLLQRVDALVHASSENAYNAAESARRAQEANAATITVDSVETLPAGSAATVTNVGTEQDARLRFGIPKGDKGDKGTGSGVPEGGNPGQVMIKTDSGEGWSDANAHNHDASAINAGTLAADRLPVAPIAKGGTGGTTEQQARDNILAGVPRIDVSEADFDADNRVNVYAMAYDEPTLPSGRMFKFDIKRFWLWIDKKIREVFGFSDESALGIANGGTGAATAEDARANLGVDLETIGAARAAHSHDMSEIQESFITARFGEEFALSASYTQVPFSAALVTVGDGFTVDKENGTIVCNRAGVVEISCVHYGLGGSGFSAGDNINIALYKNSSAMAENLARVDTASGSTYGIVIPPRPMTASVGAVISIKARNSTAARGKLGYSSYRSYVTARYISYT